MISRRGFLARALAALATPVAYSILGSGVHVPRALTIDVYESNFGQVWFPPEPPFVGQHYDFIIMDDIVSPVVGPGDRKWLLDIITN